MSNPKIKVGDYVSVTGPGLEVPNFWLVVRETNTQWVCENDERINKDALDVRGHEYRAKPIEGTATSVVFEIKNEKDAAEMSVLSDKLEEFALNAQAASLRDAVKRYRAQLNAPPPPELKPKWTQTAGGRYAPIPGRWRYRIRDRVIGTVETICIGEGPSYRHENDLDQWRIEARYRRHEGTTLSQRFEVTADRSVLAAKRWVVEQYKREANGESA